MLTCLFFCDIVCIAKKQYGSFYVSERGMHMSDRFVNLVGRIPKEDYEKILSGELTFNNGLRNAKGPASFYTKQPEMWIQDPSPSVKSNIMSILVNVGLPILLKQGIPAVIDKFKELDVNELVAAKKTKTMDQFELPDNTFDFPSNNNVISLEAYKKASNL